MPGERTSGESITKAPLRTVVPGALGLDPAVTSAEPDLRREFLHPGQMCVSSEPCIVTTIVGSCVAVCVWDPIRHMGGVTHYILPKWDGVGQASGRYGDVAVEMLVGKMVELGSYGHTLQASIFGGACMFDVFRGREQHQHLGTLNVQAAEAVLANYNIGILRRQVGGARGRKIAFHTFDGTFSVKEI